MMASSYNAKQEDGRNSGAPGHGGAAEVKSRKPDNTAFKQQRLLAWQPILTASTVTPAFFVIGIFFIPIGIALFVTSNNVREFEVDYTGVSTEAPCFACARNFTWNSTTPCSCSIPFILNQPFDGNVYMYYGLSNFYQNHRRYVKSRDDSQLYGDKSSLTSPNKECEPYRTRDGLPIAPCGAIANSLFNDSLELFYVNSSGASIQVPLVKKGIAWWTDRHVKFRNPGGNDNLTAAFEGTTNPPNWRKPVYELDLTDSDNNGFNNEDLIVWMRTAAMPTFRKLYRIIHKKSVAAPTLPSGNYILKIDYNFPVLDFNGRKRMILSTISWMGGKNPVLGLSYIIVGSVCFILAITLLIIHYKFETRNTSNTSAEIPS